MAEANPISIDTVDANGNPITIFSTTGSGRTQAEFINALNGYDSPSKYPGEGFKVLPQGALNTLRKGFESTLGSTARALPEVGETVGQLAGGSPLLMLLQKAGLVSPETATAIQQPISTAGGAVGRKLGEVAAQPIATPSNLGTTVGTAVASRYLKPVMAAEGGMRVAPFISNIAKLALGAGTGSAGGSLMFGENVSPGKVGVDMAIAAGTGLAQNVLSLWINRYITPHKQADFAQEMLQVIADRYPTLKGNPDLFNIAVNAPGNISKLTQKMTEGLRGSVDDVTKGLTNQAKRGLKLSPGEQSTLRSHIREFVKLQNEVLDNIDNPEKVKEVVKQITGYVDETGNTVIGAKNKLLDYFDSVIPKGDTSTPAYNQIRRAVQSAENDFVNLQEGAKVLSKLKEAGAGGKLDLMKFAQLIRGTYQQPGNPLLEQVGNVLGGGRPLPQMPLPGERESGGEFGRYALNTIKNMIPFVRHMESLPYKGPNVPWPNPSMTPLAATAARTGAPQVLQPLGDFAVNSSGQAAIRQFFKDRERK